MQGPQITPNLYNPTVIAVRSLADVVFELGEGGEVVRNNTIGGGRTTVSGAYLEASVTPVEALTLRTPQTVVATVHIVEVPPAPSLEQRIELGVSLKPDPERGHFADRSFSVGSPGYCQVRVRPWHHGPEHRGTHHPEFQVFGPDGIERPFQQGTGPNEIYRTYRLGVGEYRVRVEAADDRHARFCKMEPSMRGCDELPDAERNYDVGVEWDYIEVPSRLDVGPSEPEPRPRPTTTLDFGTHEVEVAAEPERARLAVDVPHRHDLFVATSSGVPLYYETRVGGERTAVGVCQDNRCVLPRVEAEEVFIAVENVPTPTVVPLEVQTLPPMAAQRELFLESAIEVELSATTDPRGPMSVVSVNFEQTGVFLLTAKAQHGPVSPPAELSVYNPLGEAGAHDTCGMLFVEEEHDGVSVMTSPDYAAMFIEVETPGVHAIRIDGNGRAPARTLALELVPYNR